MKLVELIKCLLFPFLSAFVTVVYYYLVNKDIVKVNYDGSLHCNCQ